MASLTPFLKQRFFDSNGAPLVGGKLYSYTAGTTSPRATYTDQTGLVPNTNPVILDANGEANVWIANGFYKFVLASAADVVQYTIDRVTNGTGGEIPTSDLATDPFSGNGSQTVFTLLADPLAQVNTYVFISGVYQSKSTYTVLGTTLTFSEAPPTGTNNIEVMRGTAMAIGTIADLTITTAKLAAGAVTTSKILNDSVTTAKIVDLNVTTAKINDLAVTTAKLADSAVTTAKIADGSVTGIKLATAVSAVSASSGNVNSASASFVDVPNLSVTLTVVAGRPVFLSFTSASTSSGTFVTYASNSGIQFLRGSTVVSFLSLSGASNIIPGSAISCVDLSAPAGTHVYKAQYYTSSNINVVDTKLLAVQV